MDEPVIEFENISKRFNGRTVLDRVNLKIYEGQVTTLIGKSGTGKSVLLKHVIGLLLPDEGVIRFRGKPFTGLSKEEWDAYRSRISYMFQNNALFDSMTVFENIALPLNETASLSKKAAFRKIYECLEQMELRGEEQKYPSELSGGMQKRVALARALVTEPRIVLFDEPTTGQDPIRKNAILSMIVEYQRTFGFTALLVSHEIPDVFFISNRVLVLHEGSIIFQGSPEELDEFEHPFFDEFIQSLEGFQDELTGFYSKRHFKLRYQTDLRHKDPEKPFTVVVFSLEDLDRLSTHLGHTVSQEVVRSLAAYINDHLGAVGGISVRRSKDRILTVLPFSDRDEAAQIVARMGDDLQGSGLREIQAGVNVNACFEFAILAGLAEGRSSDELDELFERARSRQGVVARCLCEQRREEIA